MTAVSRCLGEDPLAFVDRREDARPKTLLAEAKILIRASRPLGTNASCGLPSQLALLFRNA